MISVIIPVYNVEKYLNQCLDSVCNQSFKNLEIICVNDGSTDNSLEILKDYSKKDDRIKIISQDNNGLGHARNTGLKHAAGDYVFFLDSDDFLCENCLEELYLNITSNGSDLVIFNFFIFHEREDTYNSAGLLINELFGELDYNNFTFNYKDIKKYIMDEYFAAWFKLYKKEFLDKHELCFPEGIAFEDVLFQIQSFLYAEKISFLPKSLYNYRVTDGSLTRDNSKIWDILDVAEEVEKFLKELSVYDYFKNEFLMFKIFHFTCRMYLSRGTGYFDFVKNEFLSIKNDVEMNRADLSDNHKQIFHNVLTSESLEEYLKL